MTMDTEKAIAMLYAPARVASDNAYSPYSGVRVGASVLDEEGRIYSGCNVENASYGLTQCAERNALAAAVNAGVKPGTIKTLVVYATGFEVLAPCGACRQVMSELLANDAVIIACQSETDFHSWSIGELLPDSFVLG
jgi:cytidine deaminase